MLNEAGALGKVGWVDTFSDKCDEEPPYLQLTIKTLEGDMTAQHGDYIIKGVRGEYYSCRSDIFDETYEAANVEAAESIPS